MPIRVGQIPYLNSEVFYYSMASQEGIELFPLVPRALSDSAGDGGIDAGPVPLVTCFELEDRFVPLGDYCIATVEKARSILLYSKVPVEELDGATVGVTGESSTSVRLLKALLRHRFGVRPVAYVSLQESSDAFLLIGDEALRNRNSVEGYPYRYDLGEEWHQWTGLPFVFARWMVRKDLPYQTVARLDALLARSITDGLSNLGAVAEARRDLGMSPGEIAEYVTSFHYRLGPGEHQAMTLFRDLLSRDPYIAEPTRS